jgi:sugar fermentation stimulation protein A
MTYKDISSEKISRLEHASIVGQNSSRPIDFLLEEGKRNIILEVKSCTLVGRDVAMFPDAITERGARHLRELAQLSENGHKTAVLFIVHWPYAKVFMPDYHTDLDFSQTLLQVRRSVQVIPIAVHWSRELELLPGVKLLQVPWDHIEQEAKDRGSYLLILELKNNARMSVGSLGEVVFRKGFYLYVGSAMANLSRRMERHRRLRKQHHWHIDEFRAVAEFHSILAIRSSTRLECEIASALSKLADWSVRGFGCSDCSCGTHLFGVRHDPLNSPGFHQLLQYFRMDRYKFLDNNSSVNR